MTDPRSMQADLDRIAADLATAAGDGDGDELPVMVMCDDDLDVDDPRVVALIAQARAEGRMVVTPWEETDSGELVDTSAASYNSGRPEPA